VTLALFINVLIIIIIIIIASGPRRNTAITFHIEKTRMVWLNVTVFLNCMKRSAVSL